MSWKEENHALVKEFEFETFEDAISWMMRASKVIEKQNHHPEWTNVYNKVHVKLTTHDSGNTITQKDRTLAQLLDEV